DGIPPFEPGETASLTLTLDANDPTNRYLSFASMIIPSNDAFIGNDDPTAHPVFDEMGNFVGGTLLALGADIYDAGTEVNDEAPANTAFFGQAAPDTGVTEGGVAAIHNGFLAPGQGGILDDPMFAAADFTAPDYAVFNGSAQTTLTIDVTALNEETLAMSWQGGLPPYQLQSNTNLQADNWVNVGEPTMETSTEVSLSETRLFYRIVSGDAVPEPAPATATYEVTFDATWSAGTHPTNFISSAHFSGLIGATHSSAVTLWEPGGMATPGIRNMAETGSKNPLQSEINALITAGSAENLLSGGGVNPSPGMVSLTFTASQDFPLVSLVSMIAPSPDWFIGVHDLNLFENGAWVEDLTVSLAPYDAGTDDGTGFTSANAMTSPQAPITLLTESPLAENDSTPPLGTFRFVRMP
ncbi:MAG: spondin domain-containing protein, partial [Verrucomicrobiota bacterium]